jgi:hypothetical protein
VVRPVAFLTALSLVACAAQPSPHLMVAQATPAPAPEPAPEPAPAPAPAQEKSSGTSDPMLRTFGWISIGIGAQATAVAIVTSFMMLHQKSLRDDNCSSKKLCTQAGLDANTQLGSLGGWNAGAYAIGAIGLGLGAFLVLTNPADKDKEVSAGVSPSGLTLRGKF